MDHSMHLRLDAATKRKLERAAIYAQKSVTEFVLSQAVEAADQMLKAHEQHVLLRTNATKIWRIFTTKRPECAFICEIETAQMTRTWTSCSPTKPPGTPCDSGIS